MQFVFLDKPFPPLADVQNLAFVRMESHVPPVLPCFKSVKVILGVLSDLSRLIQLMVLSADNLDFESVCFGRSLM